MPQPISATTERDASAVSIVVPTCNRRDLILQCARAVAAQTCPDFDLIIIDDGSTDDTVPSLHAWATEHPSLRFTLIQNGRNLGANPSRNRGIMAARGRLIAFLDSDCEPSPTWLANLIRGFNDHRVASVVGLVDDTPPRNIYELAFKGTHRMPRSDHAHRLVLGNMAVRADILRRFMLDEDRAPLPSDSNNLPDLTVSGRGDEEGLYLMLKAAGYLQLVAHDAVVTHHHHYDRRSFFRQAYRGGQSAARLVFKYRLPHRLDMLPFMLCYATLILLIAPAVLWSMWVMLVPGLGMLAAIAGIAFNELIRKGKSIAETLVSFPVLLAYYHVRLWGYITETFRLKRGRLKLQQVDLKKFNHS